MSNVLNRWHEQYEEIHGAYAGIVGFEADLEAYSEDLKEAYDLLDFDNRNRLFAFVVKYLNEEDKETKSTDKKTPTFTQAEWMVLQQDLAKAIWELEHIVDGASGRARPMTSIEKARNILCGLSQWLREKEVPNG